VRHDHGFARHRGRGRSRRWAIETTDDRRQAIVQAALDLLDEGGLENMSLRRLAAHLGMHAPGLYWYIESKQDLIDLMAKEILVAGMADVGPLADGQTWDDWLVELACTARKALLARRDGARVVAGAFLFRSDAVAELIELALEILEDAGFERLRALGCTMTVLRYATGIALDEQASPMGGPSDLTAVERFARLPVPEIDASRFPRAADAFQRVFDGKLRDRDAVFRWGAQMIVRGMAPLRHAVEPDPLRESAASD
jgi:TetR/AcrR family tetracycline transcriptional repressor